MPTWKQLPKNKAKRDHLPFYRPVDRWFLSLWKFRREILPFAIAFLVLGLAYGGFKFYRTHYESRASGLLAAGEPSRVVAEFPRSDAALMARMELGTKSLQEGKYDEAIQWYQAVSERSKGSGILQISALHNRALAHVKKGEVEKAVPILEEAVQDPENPASDYSRLLLARTYEIKGDGEKALDLYKALTDGTKAPSVQQEAKERMTWLQPKQP